MKTCRSCFSGLVILSLLILGAFGTVALAAEEDRQSLDLKIGLAEVFKPRHAVSKVSVVDPAVAEAVITGPREVYLIGRQIGSTSLIVADENQKRTLLDVQVSFDLTGLKRQLGQLYPGQNIEVRPAPSGIVLSGSVSGPEVVEQAVRLARSFLPRPKPAPGHSAEAQAPYEVINLLKVSGIQQVLLEVKFAEVLRRSTKDWQAALGLTGQGNDLRLSAGIGPIDISKGIKDSLTSGSLFLNFAGNTANVVAAIGDLEAALVFLEEEGLARTLAEPRLVTKSGKEASFLAGGEFPIPVVQDSGNGNAVTVQFREFGVGLKFTPVVLSDGKISLQVAPTVSDIVANSAMNIDTGTFSSDKKTFFSVPSLTTRKLETTVDLYDGQTLALAGLLQDNLVESAKKIPGLGDLPVLGSLFRSSSFLQQKTDLLITVTPHLVKPNREGTLSYPGEFIQVPNRLEFYLQSRLEGARSPNDLSALSQHGFTTRRAPLEQQGGLEGEFGHEALPIKP